MPDRGKSEQEYRTIIQASMDSFWRVEADGRIIDCNDAACAMLGYCRDELLALSLHDVDAVEDAEHAAEHMRLIITQGHDRFETRHRRKDGSCIDVEVSAYCVPGTETPLLFAFSRDISERKQAEKERLALLSQQRDTLVREVHHRIKNHLQGVSGMLQGMVNKHPESAQLLGKAIARVRAIAQVYGLQSSREDARVRLCDLLRSSAENMLGPIPVICKLPSAGNEAILAPEEAVPLALVVNELLTNAVKHCEAVDPPRPVLARLDIGERMACAEIRNGPARLPPDFDFARRRGTGTGLELVAALLPPRGAMLEFHQNGDEVVALLKLEAPVVSAIIRSA